VNIVLFCDLQSNALEMDSSSKLEPETESDIFDDGEGGGGAEREDQHQ
jgi:hypothetical protein